MTELETRYRRLLRLYPPAWRERREEEMVATYLDAAPPEGTRPSMKDGLDVAAGALREWAKTTPPGLAGGARIAGLVGLSAVGLLSALLFFGVETDLRTPLDAFGGRGLFRGAAPLCWGMWALVALASPFLRGTWSRRLALLPLLATSMLAVGDRVGFDAPQTEVLLAMAVLGTTALLHHRGSPLTRAIPALSTVAGGAYGLTVAGMSSWGRVHYATDWLHELGVAVAGFALVALLVGALLGRAEGSWAPILLGPAVAVLTDTLVGRFGYAPGSQTYDGLILGIGVLAVCAAAVKAAWRWRRALGRSPDGPGTPGRPPT